MKTKLFRRALVLAVVVILGLGSYVGYRTFTFATSAYTYLFAKTDVKGNDGVPLTRAQLLDELLRDAIRRAQAAKTEKR